MDFFDNRQEKGSDIYDDQKTETQITPEKAESMRYAYEYYKLQNQSLKMYPEKSSSVKPLVILAVVIVLGLCVFCVVSDIMKGTSSYKNDVSIKLTTQSKPEIAEEYVDDMGCYTSEGIARLVRPSVVDIVVSKKDDDDYILESGGSGIILFSEGYIATNAHVIENAGNITVTLYDDRQFSATVVGRDSKSDIAIIKINADDLTTAQLGNSDEVNLGEKVMAIGNPGGLSGSITGGIVSGINRQIRGGSTGFKMNCIQTDAAISPGNSGGALVNMYGQVIGITSSKYVSSSYEGLGFAIAINDALPIIQELIADGFVAGRVKIGITFNTIDARNAELYDIPMGIQIVTIDESSDIAKTELEIGDIITHIEGIAIDSYDTIIEILQSMSVGDIMKASVVRLDRSDRIIEEFDIEFQLMEDTEGIY